MYVITGATGHTGRLVAEKLLAAGKPVRVLGRDEARLGPLAAKGAEVMAGDLRDRAYAVRAMAGARAVYAMLPPNMQAENLGAYQEEVSEALAAGIRENGVKYAVTLSSVGADKAEKVGPVKGLYRLEQKLNGIAGLNVLHLRPGYFMENLLMYVGLVRSMGMTAGTLKEDLPLAMIATRDIAEVAAEALLKLEFTGSSTRELLGARDVTMKEAAGILGRAIGKPELKYSQLPAMMVKPALVSMGLSRDMAEQLLEMMEALNTGWMRPLEARSEKNTTPTTLEWFATEVFRPAYQARA